MYVHQEQNHAEGRKPSGDCPQGHGFTEEFCKCVLVTGGAGFVGSHVAEALLKEGRKVVVYDVFNSETSSRSEKQENIAILEQIAKAFACKDASLTVVNGDVRDQYKLIDTIQAHCVTACVHAGAMVCDRRSVEYPEEYMKTNAIGTMRLFEALGKCGVKMVVQASTCSVFGQRKDNIQLLDESSDRRPINPYGASKVAADSLGYCYSYLYKMNVTQIRFFATYGPR